MKSLSITIRKLFGDRDLSLDILNDVTVIIAENGKGKTTILQILYAIFTGKIYLLLKYEFESINIEDNEGRKCKIKRKDVIQNHSPELSKLRKIIGDENIFKVLNQINFGDNVRSDSVRKMVFDISRKIDVPTSYVYDLIKNFESRYNFSNQLSIFDRDEPQAIRDVKYFKRNKVLFWPTYRRVERNIKIERDESGESESYAFGMSDIEKKLNDIEKSLSEDALSLTVNMNRDLIVDTLNEKRPPNAFYSSIKNRIPEINLILERTKILKEKEMLINIIETDSISNDRYLPLAQIIYRLLDGFRALAEKDEKIKNFTSAVNNYLVDNEFVYDDRTVRIFCRNKFSGRLIKLEHMSSGEKHIIGFMSYLYLIAEDKHCILIDEPELSLSSEWQEKLLVDIMRSGQVQSLVCATHSPFIFNNIYSDRAVPLITSIKVGHDK